MVKFNLVRFKTKKWHIFLFLGLLCTSFGFSQEIVVKGTVLSSTDNMPLPGANVSIAGTNIGAATDFDGNYEITVSPGAQLSFSYIGYITQTISVNGNTVIDVILTEDLNDLEEVVVIGYGVQKKSLNTGANLNVKGEDLTRLSTTNALQALQGQVPGAQITSTSGQPGEGLRVVIRGIGSTGNNSPLYVVDGVLTGDINYLNNSDIESISILKDAASAAIYGSQASNGVVLVTTKKGTKNKSGTITFDQYYGLQSVPNKIDMLNSREYATIMNEAAINSGQSPYFSNAEIAALGEGTDWIDEMMKDNTITQNYSFGASGGSENSIYSTSLSYVSDEGVIGGGKLSKYERYNFRINTEHNLYKNVVKIGQTLNMAYIKSNGIDVGNQYNNTLRGAFNASPFLPMYAENGDFYDSTNSSWNNTEANPYALMVYNNQQENDNQKIVGNVFLEIAPFKGLTFRTSYGIDYYAGEDHSYTPEYSLSVYAREIYNRASQSMNKGKTLIWDNLLTYDFNIANNHSFEAMVGTSSYQYSGTSMYTENSNLLFEELKYGWIDNTRNQDDPVFINIEGKPEYENKRMSYFGRLNYNYKEKYLLNATFRADGSSQFDNNNRWGYYPSVSAGWIISRETFLEDSSLINFFKLRVSWGQVGNQNAGNLQYLSPVATDVNYSFGNEEGSLTPGAYIYRLSNPGLKWEISEQTNVGFDAVILNNSLNINFDLYQKTNKDWLVKAPIPATAGAEAPWINGGDVVNKGVELALTYNNSISDFYYSIGINGSYNENEVGNIPTGDGIVHGEANQLFDNSSEFYRAEEGYPLGYFWGLETDGIFQTQEQINNYTRGGQLIQPSAQPGDVIYIDRTGDGVISDLDKTMIGDPNPDFIYGLSLGINYKAFDFSMLANGVAGNQIVQSYRNLTNDKANFTTAIFDRWHGEGSSNTTPRVTRDNRNWSKFSDLFVQDGDYLRISNVTVGLDIAKLNVSDKFFASQFRIYFSALNVHTFTKYNGMDPEVGYGISNDDYNFSSGVDLGYYPRPRTFLMGINVKL